MQMITVPLTQEKSFHGLSMSDREKKNGVMYVQKSEREGFVSEESVKAQLGNLSDRLFCTYTYRESCVIHA